MSIPLRPLTNHDLTYYAKRLGIPYFRGVFMRDSMPVGPPHRYESAIVNLDSSSGTGTHWVCYKKRGNKVYYFDSFGDLRPPADLVRYFGPRADIQYNYDCQQSVDSVICGHLCLKFLSNVLP